eukprot:scaffold1619_cov292-Pavlova_lutheri.AAC.6
MGGLMVGGERGSNPWVPGGESRSNPRVWGGVQPIERERGEVERTSTVEAARVLPNAHARHDHPRAMLHVWEGERRGRHGRDGKR